MTVAAFFDVDETLITVKSMFAFLRHWIVARGGDEGDFDATVAGIHQAARSGAPRTEINRMYYRLFAGVALADLRDEGRAWYRGYGALPTAWVADTLFALTEHQRRGDAVVLVSGSFRACLDPIAEAVGAESVLCTEPVVDADGRLTGEVVRPMIGEHKGAAVRELIAARGLDARRCFCYGDHASDLPMLTAVGRPRIVGADPVLLEHAAARGWPVLSDAPCAFGERAHLLVQQIGTVG